jgi:hypothetical protein
VFDLGKPYFLLIVNDHGEEVLKKYNSDFVLHLNKIGKAIKYLKKNNIIEIIMIGAVNRPALKNMFPDLWTAKFLASISNKMLGDDKVLSNLAIALEKEGFKIIAPENILPNILSKKGVMGKISPQESHLRDMKIGFEIAKNIGKYDIGQSLVIEDGLIIALEAIEGTAAMINRASKAIINPSSITKDCPISYLPIFLAISKPIFMSRKCDSWGEILPITPFLERILGNIFSGAIILKPSFSRAIAKLDKTLSSPNILLLIEAKNLAVHKSGNIFFNAGRLTAPIIIISIILFFFKYFIALPILFRCKTKSELYFLRTSSP